MTDEKIEWHVNIYPAHESALYIHEIYGTKEEAEHRLNAVESAMRRGGVIRAGIPEAGSWKIVNGSMIVGTMMYRKKVDE